MRIPPARVGAVMVSLVASLLSDSWGTSSIVLCFGADGHIALELSQSACCASPEKVPALSAHSDYSFSARAVQIQYGGQCGQCEDISISALIGMPRLSSGDQSSRTNSAVLTAFRYHNGSVDRIEDPTPPPPLIASLSHLAFLRTVALLI